MTNSLHTIAIICLKALLLSNSNGLKNRRPTNDYLKRRLRRVTVRPFYFSSCILLGVSALPVNAQDSKSKNQTAANLYDLLHQEAVFLGPLAIVIGGCVAIWSILSNRAIARKNATFRYFFELQWDKDYIDHKTRFLDLKRRKARGKFKFDSLATEYEDMMDNGKNSLKSDDEVKSLMDNHASVKILLNEYEAMAVAIKAGALDEQMIRDNREQTIISDYKICEPFIQVTQVRAGEDKSFSKPEKIYCEIKALVEKWKSELPN